MPELPIARLARRIVAGRRRSCAECRTDLGVTHEQFCSGKCADAYQDRFAY